MKTVYIISTLFSLLFLSNSCDVFTETFDDLPEEDKVLLNAFRKGDTIKLKSTKSSEIFELIVSEKKEFYYATEDIGLGQHIEWEQGKVKFEHNSKRACTIDISATRDSQTEYWFDLNFEEYDFFLSIKSIDDSIKYKKNQELVDGNYTYSNVYIFNYTKCDTCAAMNKIYLNAEYGLLKIENIETSNAYTLVR